MKKKFEKPEITITEIISENITNTSSLAANTEKQSIYSKLNITTGQLE